MMKDSVKILLLGDERVGKSTLLSSFVSQCFAEKVPAVHTPVQIPASESAEKVNTIIIDSSSEENEQLYNKIREADAIILVYDHTRETTLRNIQVHWLRLIKQLWGDVNKPVILAGNKYDMKPQETGEEDAAGGSSAMKTITAILEEFRFVLNTFDECSAKTLDEVPEVFVNAQKLVIYPVWPLYDMLARDFTPKLHKVLCRIFRVFDADHDGVLNDTELNTLQDKCFKSQLHQDDLDEVKKIVSKNVENGVRGGAITLEGFHGIVRLFIEQMQVDMPWTMLRTLGYNDDLELRVSAKEEVELGQEAVDTAHELSPDALAFLRRVFHQYKGPGGLLKAPQLANIMSVLPDGDVSPWQTAGEGSAIKCLAPQLLSKGDGGDEAGLDMGSWLALWQMVAALDPGVAVRHLRSLGCCCGAVMPTPADSLLHACRRWKRASSSRRSSSSSRHHKKSSASEARHAFHALLFSTDRAESDAMLYALCGLSPTTTPPPPASVPGLRACACLATMRPSSSAASATTATGAPPPPRSSSTSSLPEDEAKYLIVTQVPPPSTTTGSTSTAASTPSASGGGAAPSFLQQAISVVDRCDAAIILVDARSEESIDFALKVLGEVLPARLPVLFLQKGGAPAKSATALSPQQPAGPLLLPPGTSGSGTSGSSSPAPTANRAVSRTSGSATGIDILPGRLGGVASSLKDVRAVSVPSDPLLAKSVYDNVAAQVAAMSLSAFKRESQGSYSSSSSSAYKAGEAWPMQAFAAVAVVGVAAVAVMVAGSVGKRQRQ